MKLDDGCTLLLLDVDLIKKMLDVSPTHRVSVKEAVNFIDSLALKEAKEKSRFVVAVKGSFELGTRTLDEKKLKIDKQFGM